MSRNSHVICQNLSKQQNMQHHCHKQTIIQTLSVMLLHKHRTHTYDQSLCILNQTTVFLGYSHLPEGSFVRDGVVQIPKYDPNRSSPNSNSSPNPMPMRFGQTTLRTSELSPLSCAKEVVFIVSSYFV